MKSISMWVRMYLLLSAPLACIFSGAYGAKDVFTEELLLKPIGVGDVYAHFHFTTVWNVDFADKPSNYRLFPKPLGEILSHYSVQELHISQTQGLWRHEKWGYPVLEAPPGAEIWAWFSDEVDVADVDEKWAGLVNSLSGLFGASLNFVNRETSISPEISFRPEGLSATPETHNSSYVRYAALPSETVCTENLTPWKKLVPCGGRAGLSALLEATRLYDTAYHSMGVHVRPVCRGDDCAETAFELAQTLSLVFNVMRHRDSLDWSIRSLFGVTLRGACPVSAESTILLDQTRAAREEDLFRLTVPANRTARAFGDDAAASSPAERTFAVYDVRRLAASGKTNVGVAYARRPPHARHPPPVYAHQSVTGYGQAEGGIMCDIHNTGPTVSAVYLLVVPWYVQLFVHSLAVTRSDGRRQRPLYTYFVPGRTRARPYHLEVVVTLEARGTTRIHVEFERKLMKWSEYPPDANHGFYAGSAAITTLLARPDNLSVAHHAPAALRLAARLRAPAPYFIRLYTEPLLVTLPVPDFSMPYNVICLVGTVVAIMFGTIHNVTTRRLLARRRGGPGAEVTLKDRVLAGVTRVVRQVKEKFRNRTANRSPS